MDQVAFAGVDDRGQAVLHLARHFPELRFARHRVHRDKGREVRAQVAVAQSAGQRATQVGKRVQPQRARADAGELGA
jgi:hypothetical protein